MREREREREWLRAEYDRKVRRVERWKESNRDQRRRQKDK